MMTFKEFIEQYTDDDSIIGDFACDVVRTKGFPCDEYETDVEEYSIIREFLRFRRASTDVVKAFKEAYSLYLTTRSEPKDL